MKKIITIIGARPQIIKASAISREIKKNFSDSVQEIIVHTGQHYDENMSAIFFKEMDIPEPRYNLNVGSASHAVQTAEIMKGIEEIIISEQADALLIYGDTNSTLAGALAASKINIPVVHIEAGLRSFDKKMPEEINRILSDHVSTLLFCPTQTAVNNLLREGFSSEINKLASLNQPNIYLSGDIMFDNSLYFAEKSEKESNIISQLQLRPEHYILCTIHRNSNTDDRDKINAIFEALITIQHKHQLTIVLPLHPRTKKMMEQLLLKEIKLKLEENKEIKIIPPAGFLDIIALEKNARIILTDSGGLQKEAYFFQKPCVILRPQTEWVEIVENGNAIIADSDAERIIDATYYLLTKNDFSYPTIFGGGKASNYILHQLIKHI